MLKLSLKELMSDAETYLVLRTTRKCHGSYIKMVAQNNVNWISTLGIDMKLTPLKKGLEEKITFLKRFEDKKNSSDGH